MGIAGLNTALNALAASSLATQGAATTSSSAITGQSENQPEIVDGRVGAAGSHHTSARALQLRACKFAQPKQPVEEGDFTHIGGNAMLSGAMMLGDAGSDDFLGLGLSLEDRLMRVAIWVGAIFLMYAIPSVIKFAKDIYHEARLTSELKKIDWVGEHASEIASHAFRYNKRCRRQTLDQAIEAVTSMPLSPAKKLELFKNVFIDRCPSSKLPFHPWSNHVQILDGIGEAMNESGYSPEEVLEITRSLLANEHHQLDFYIINDFIGHHMAPALKALKDEGCSADEAISVLERQLESRK